MKGIALISGVIFLAITITAVIIIYQTGVPFIRKLQSAVTVNQIQSAFSNLNEIIKTVASEGPGSQRTITLSIDNGKVVVNGTEDYISWDFETDSFIISPRTSQKIDNMKIGSNLDASAYEDVLDGIPVFVLENKNLKVYIKKIGSETNMERYNTSDLLMKVYNKNTGQDLDFEYLEILIDNGNSTGKGYTVLEEEGKRLPTASVRAFLDPDTSDIFYNIRFILESDTDFITIRGST